MVDVPMAPVPASETAPVPTSVARWMMLPYVVSCLLVGLAVVLVLGLPQPDTKAFLSYPIASAILTALNAAAALRFRRLLSWFVVAEFAAVLALWGLVPVVIVAATLGSFALAGRLLMKWAGLAPAYAGDPILGLATGLVAFGWLMQGIAFLPVHNVFAYSGLLVVALVLGRREMSAWISSGAKQFDAWTGHRDLDVRLVVGLACSTVVFFAYVTRIPEMGTDGLMTHLAVTNQIVRDGHFIPDIGTLTWAYIPKPMHFAYLPVHILAGEYGLRLLHVSLAILATAAVGVGIGRAGSPRAGWVTVAFLVGSPLLLQESATIFVENYLSFVGVAATLALVRLWKDGFPLRESAVTGMLFGGLAAAKFQGFVFAPPLALVFAAGLLTDRFSAARLRATGAAALAYLVVAAPSYVIPWIGTGNPLFPLFNDVFRSPFFSVAPYSFNFARPPVDLAMWLGMAVDGAPYLEAGGPVSMFHIYFLAPMTLVGLVVWRRCEFVIPALLGLGHVVLVIAAQNYLRYHTAGFFVLSMAAGLAMAWLWEWRLSRAALVAVGAVILVANALYAVRGSYFYMGLRVHALASAAGQARIELWRAPERELVRAADALLGSGERAAIFYQPYIGLSKSNILPLHPFFGYAAWQDFERSMAKSDPVPFFNKYGITHVILRHSINFNRSDELKAWLTAHAEVVKTNDGAALYAISPAVLLNRAVIPRLSVDEWQRHGSADATAEGNLRVSGQDLALKFFEAKPGEAFQLALRAHCLRGKAAWLHVNWYNDEGKHLRADIVSRPCASGVGEYRAQFHAPAEARRGAVILDTQPDVQMEISAVELMKKESAL